MSYRDKLASYRTLLPPDLKPIETLAAYKAQGGCVGLEKALALSPEEVIEEIKQAGLRGRGGAGFPTHIKWNGVRNDPSCPKYVVCNGSEGEPGTYKDRFVLRHNAYQLIEGLLIARHAVGVEKVYIGTKAKFTRELDNLYRAQKEMIDAGLMRAETLTIVPGPDDYLFGEERALLEFIDNGSAMPRVAPTYVQGVNYSPNEPSPTVVNNVETFCHAAHIMAKGAKWFRSRGSQDTVGTMVFTLCGDLRYPGMYELPLGLTLNELLYDVGGGPLQGRQFKAVFSGVANPVISPDMFDTALDFGSLRAAGSGLGSAGFIVYDDRHCIVKIAILLSDFLARESCGQCMPCKSGTRRITDLLLDIEKGQADSSTLTRIEEECARVNCQTRCYLSTEEQILIRSILDKYRSEIESHLTSSCPFPGEPFFAKINDFDKERKEFIYAPQVV